MATVKRATGAASMVLLALALGSSSVSAQGPCSGGVGGSCWSLATNGADIFNNNTGNVGIGTQPGTYKLDLLSAIDGGGLNFVRRFSTMPTGQPQGSILLESKSSLALADGFGPALAFRVEGSDTGGIARPMGRIGAVRSGDNDHGKLVFMVGNGSQTETVRLIITNDPVIGVQAQGVPLTATYADLAEWVAVRGSADPGTVMVVEAGRTNEVSPSHSAYDTKVAGVVSSKPGIVLGEAGEGKATVATTGRVRVKCLAGNSAIHVGDLLVTSDREGYAMKSEPIEVAGVKIHRPGTLIGKALEPLAQGDGEILVLLSLQ